jgi:predicted AAA+ superfamily ATPase
MQDLKLLREILVSDGYKNDRIIKNLCGTVSEKREKAIRAYSEVCEILMIREMSLSEYIFRLAVDGSGIIMDNYLKNNSETLYTNIKRDIAVLAEFSSITPDMMISYFRKKFGIGNDIIFPVYNNGHCDITADSVIGYRKKYGTTVFADNKAFIYSGGALMPIRDFDKISIEELKNYEAQKNAVSGNTLCFMNGKKHSNVLLYGDRGTGKSSTVKAIVNKYDELRIVLIPKNEITDLYNVYDILGRSPLRFILFLDDLSFKGEEKEYSFLKQALEGSVRVMPENCVIYATTNRRHIVKETSSEQADEHHGADARDANASLADRFGLFVTYLMPDKRTYLDIVRKMAEDRHLDIPAEKIDLLAERFAVRKACHSPRTARQFVDKLDAFSALGMDMDKI